MVPVPDSIDEQNQISAQIDEEKKLELIERIKHDDQALLTLVGSMIPKIETSEETTTEGYEYIADVRLSKTCYQQPSATTIAKTNL